MAELTENTSTAIDYDAILKKLSDEFGDLANDTLAAINFVLDDMEEAGRDEQEMTDMIERISRDCHNLKGSASNFGFPILTMICEKMEDYMSEIREITPKEIKALRVFADRMSEVVEMGDQSTDYSKAIRQLPQHSYFNPADVEVRDVEALLVMPRNASTTIVRKELQACGYTVNFINNPYTALEFAIRAKPDFVVLSPVLDDFDGIDFTLALKAMAQTQAIPVVMVTSMNRSSRAIKRLPEDVPLVDKGSSFSDELAQALQKLNLI